jgi:hypothetical protein
MIFSTSEDLRKVTKDVKLKNLKEKISKEYLVELHDYLHKAALCGTNIAFINKEDKLYSNFNNNVREFLRLLDYNIYDNYCEEEDYEFYGYIIKW